MLLRFLRGGGTGLSVLSVDTSVVMRPDEQVENQAVSLEIPEEDREVPTDGISKPSEVTG